MIHTMLIMYASHLIIESPRFLSSSAVMEQMPVARLFLRRLRQSSTLRLVTGSVCESASGVACSASRWSSASVASHGLLIPSSHRRRGATTVFGQNRHHRSDTASSF